jgi:hypothetical protein
LEGWASGTFNFHRVKLPVRRRSGDEARPKEVGFAWRRTGVRRHLKKMSQQPGLVLAQPWLKAVWNDPAAGKRGIIAERYRKLARHNVPGAGCQM